MEIDARSISKGTGKGPALITREPLSFLGGIDPKTGEIIEEGHPLKGEKVSGKMLIFPHGKGSTVGSYVMLGLSKNNKAPAGIINAEAEPIIIVGAIIAGIPMVDKPAKDIFKLVKNGDILEIDGTKGKIRL